jgi:hypothetical protein
MSGRDDDLPFRFELWDDADRQVEEVIERASDFLRKPGSCQAVPLPAQIRHHGSIVVATCRCALISRAQVS